MIDRDEISKLISRSDVKTENLDYIYDSRCGLQPTSKPKFSTNNSS